MTKRVKKLEKHTPPTITVANGFCTSAPTSVDMVMGNNPIISVKTVMTTGLSRVVAASTIVSLVSFPFCRNSLIKDTITVPFNTHSPKSEINPTPAEILRGMSLKNNATIPPVAAKGTVT